MKPSPQRVAHQFPDLFAFPRVLFLALFSLLATAHAQSPPFRWAARAGSAFDDYSRGIAVDAAGNSYVTGSFHDVVAFGSTNLTSSGGYDIFVAKYDNAGNVLWAQQAGSSLYDDVGLAIGGDFDIFVAKYDGTGELVWVNQAGGTLDDVGYGIAVDAAGNSFVTGYFNSPTAAFGTNNLNNSNVLSTNSPDIFVAKYNPGGDVVWAKQAGGN